MPAGPVFAVPPVPTLSILAHVGGWMAERGCTTTGIACITAQLGRFCSRDPVAYEAGANLSCYVRARPIVAVDPSGRTSERPPEMVGYVARRCKMACCALGSPGRLKRIAEDAETEGGGLASEIPFEPLPDVIPGDSLVTKDEYPGQLFLNSKGRQHSALRHRIWPSRS